VPQIDRSGLAKELLVFFVSADCLNGYVNANADANHDHYEADDHRYW
jgi:hypothetical protein